MLSIIISIFFFFSSRRRHTRFDCDWSSDVCSSDLRSPWCDAWCAAEVLRSNGLRDSLRCASIFGDLMHRRALIVLTLVVPSVLAGQSPPTPELPNAVMLQFIRFADIFGSRLVAAFDSIPAVRYDYRPTPSQQTIGYIAQHLENANYSLCERLGILKHPRTPKDSLSDTVKAQWPKDTLVERLEASLRFCDTALERMGKLESPALASTLLAFETDLAEHYSQISSYMRLLGMVPPSALPQRARVAIELPASALSPYVGVYEVASGHARPLRQRRRRHHAEQRARVAIELPASALSPYVGVYEVASGLELDVTLQNGALHIRSSIGGAPAQLWPESNNDFFAKGVDAQVTFVRDASGAVSGLVLHQYGRDRPAKKRR